MKSLLDIELKNLATTPGPQQDLAFFELARRIRENPLAWSQHERRWIWNPLDCTRGPNAREMEWACLKWSQRLIDGNIRDFEHEQNARLDVLERYLDQDPDSLEIKYHNAIGAELRRQREGRLIRDQ